MTVTVNELDALCAEAYKLDQEWEVINEQLKEKNKELEAVKSKILAHFEATDKEKYAIKGLGTVYVHNRFTVALPKGDNKEIFFLHLKEKGIFEQMVSVHSATLNSWYQEEMDAALADGNDDFKVPGIDEPKVVRTIKLRKA